MSLIITDMLKMLRAITLVAACGLLLAACANAPQIPPAEQPLSRPAMMLMGHKGMEVGSPIFIRIFKQESELEVWKARDDGRFYHYKTYPICNWSGELGPKVKQGDKQAPEGFYTVASGQMNPNSSFHIAFNLGYPNAYDRAHNRTGDFLMVHGKCRSAGCYAMTDALIEEIYALAREAFRGGQERIEVHAFPFRMTDANMELHRDNKWYKFWRTLKEGYDHFEVHRIPPTVAVCNRNYIVNVHLPQNSRIDPIGHCPRFMRPQIEPFVPRSSTEQQIALERYTAPGQRMRTVASETQSPIATGAIGTGPKFGLGIASSGYTQSPPSAALGFNQ
ncbi:L,D-transpeptidase family protein [Filomicrobium insigne]|nr:murein L,D-transpeptidase family protein [Filomicrobium insigne]